MSFVSWRSLTREARNPHLTEAEDAVVHFVHTQPTHTQTDVPQLMSLEQKLAVRAPRMEIHSEHAIDAMKVLLSLF